MKVAAIAKTPPQLGMINLLKAVAAQLIVLHHLAFYGPMADAVRPMWTGLIDWLGSSARIAVQVFLVVGGFLAARSLSPSGGAGHADPLGAIRRRYAKLAPPFFVATLMAVMASALAALLMTHDSISPLPTPGQLAAHALLLHGVLGYPSVSAGAWYVAIDFQLYALVVGMLWLCGRMARGRQLPWLVPAASTLGMLLSLLYFNLDADWDNWALYFFGSYALGMMAWWTGDPRRTPLQSMVMMSTMVLPGLVALGVHYRSRIALAVLVACVLVLFGRLETVSGGLAARATSYLGKISYSVFLIHFPVCLLVNAVFTSMMPAAPAWQAAGMAAAWSASLAAGAAFFRWVETPLGRAIQAAARRRPQAAPLPMAAARRGGTLIS
ncbi:acyltransferase family protein [Oxalobacteraceae bacterium A2-2]